ncbi:hypothetical protein POTOM_031134 [Populus tomentosa]|uniref:Phosphoribosylformylglycinamidine synthase n=1 Tax=Populus tomentosa TaxID=118781 RepID=A0A8X7ZC42_POPTO|nr:hypothetical protein POTOM_031134 [Populus tomentosa]
MVSGQNDADLDFNAVQRGDAEMPQKLYLVVRSCIEMGENNPIISIHDQGAGGNCNVVKEIIYPKGAQIDIQAIVVGDHTMPVLEIWGAEYQEQDAILVKAESRDLLQSICKRERVSMAVIGTISGEGRVVLVDMDLELKKVLGDMPQKSFEFHRVVSAREPLDIAPDITVTDALMRVLRLPSTYTDLTGGACAIGEQPIKGLVNPKAVAGLAAGEALTNLVWAKITSLSDVKASGNWMYAAKLNGEGADMYDAATALSEAMIELGIAIDGGKDSLSMAAHAGGEIVKAPGNLVISAYVTCPEITKTITPDLKLRDEDLEDVSYLKKTFEFVQDLITEEIISSGHDISDGGLLVCALEMAFAGNCGILLDLISKGESLFETVFAEELGLVLEVSRKNLDIVMQKLNSVGVSGEIIGRVTASPLIELKVDGVTQLKEETSFLRHIWEETSFHLEKFRRLASCVDLEKEGLKSRHEPTWRLSFTPTFTGDKYMISTSKPKVAVIREEGSNGDREMSAAFYAAGFEPWDITMSDLLNGVITPRDFIGIVFAGGFSYANVLDSAKGPQVGGVFGTGGDPSQPRFVRNESGRFECRFTSVTIEDSPAIMFKGMEGSTLGVWAAHGEGRAYFPDDGVLDRVIHSNLAPVRYFDDDGNPTEVYPFNVNGSPLGVAAICSPDGRHLAMMPHLERCFLMWQFPWPVSCLMNGEDVHY